MRVGTRIAVLILVLGLIAARSAVGDPFEGLTVKRCNFHVHTAYSATIHEDPPGVCTWARLQDHGWCEYPEYEISSLIDGCGLDLIGFTDHGSKLGYQCPSGSGLEWDALDSLAVQHTSVLRGFEWTWSHVLPWYELWELLEGGKGNHVNIFQTVDYCDANPGQLTEAPFSLVPTLDYDSANPTGKYLYKWIVDRGAQGPICQFNHPWFAGDAEEGIPAHFNDFALPVRPADQEVLRYFCLVEVAGGPDTAVTNYHPVSVGEPYYRSALMHGWKVAPSIGDDNYGAYNCDARTRHTGVWATSLTDVPHALQARCTFASENPDLELKFWIDDGGAEHRMGWTETPVAVPRFSTLHLWVSDPSGGTDPTAFLFTPGSTAALPWTTAPSGSYTVGAWTYSLDSRTVPAEGATFYVRVITSSGWALSAPIWVTRQLTVSGEVHTNGGLDMPGVVMSGLPGNPTTDAFGRYAATVPVGWSGTVTPQKDHWTFSPASQSYSALSSDHNQDYVGTPDEPVITGQVRTHSYVGIPGVVMNGLPHTPVTDENGYYVDTIPYHGSVTITPLKTDYSFTPTSQSYPDVVGNIPGVDFEGTALHYTISGHVRDGAGTGISGVAMQGLPHNPITNSSGYYLDTVPDDWSGTVLPQKDGLNFAPPEQAYYYVHGSYENADFTGSVITYTISGHVRDASGTGMLGVLMQGLPHAPTTDSSGYYSDAVPYDWSGAVTPQKTGFTFQPPALQYYYVKGNYADQDFTGNVVTYTISGHVLTSGGAPIAGVTMTGLLANPVTDVSGTYQGTVDYGWSGTVTPQKDGWTFVPTSRPYSSLTADQPNQDYAGTVASPVAAEAGPNKTIASGGSATLEGSASGGVPPYTYAWSPTTGLSDPDVAQPTASPSTTTTYTLTVQDSLAQSSTDTATVTVATPVVAEAGPNKTIGPGGSTTLEGSASGGVPPYTYAWSPTTGLSNPNVAQPTASPSTTTTYTLTVQDSLSQTANDTVTVTVSGILDSGSVSPASGTYVTDFTYQVRYIDASNIAPASVWVAISTGVGATPTWHQMVAEDAGDTNYVDGAWFVYTTKLPVGQYRYRFAANVGDRWVYGPQPTGTYLAGPTVTLPPLSLGTVSPVSGTCATDFTYRVRYANASNTPPTAVWVAISSGVGSTPVWRIMTGEDAGDTTYADGKWFVYTTKLAPGQWRYRFAVNVNGQWTYWPDPPGTYVTGPTVFPLLSSGYVMPTSGTSSTNFTWRVKYWNSTNASPDEIKVAIWFPTLKTTYWYTMWAYDPTDTNCKDGKWYTYSRKWLPPGAYAYRFAARQGTWWAYWPSPAGSYASGPAVGP